MDDLISRQAVLDAIEDEWHGCTGEYPASTIINDTCQRIEQLPTAEPLTDVEQSIDDKVADLPSEAYYNKDWKSDMISRQAAIDALEKDKAETDHIIMGMSGAEKEFSYHLAQRNQLDCDIDTIKRLPSAEPQTEINMAYMRGKIDGINYCTERLRKMRMEVEHEID